MVGLAKKEREQGSWIERLGFSEDYDLKKFFLHGVINFLGMYITLGEYEYVFDGVIKLFFNGI